MNSSETVRVDSHVDPGLSCDKPRISRAIRSPEPEALMTKRATAKRQRRQSAVVPPITRGFMNAVTRLMHVKPPKRKPRKLV